MSKKVASLAVLALSAGLLILSCSSKTSAVHFDLERTGLEGVWEDEYTLTFEELGGPEVVGYVPQTFEYTTTSKISLNDSSFNLEILVPDASIEIGINGHYKTRADTISFVGIISKAESKSGWAPFSIGDSIGQEELTFALVNADSLEFKTISNSLPGGGTSIPSGSFLTSTALAFMPSMLASNKDYRYGGICGRFSRIK